MYFDECKTIADLKKAYKPLAMKNHPDCGGDEEVMKQINSEYEETYKAIKAGIKERTHSKKIDLSEVDDGYRATLLALLRIENIKVELCGEWLWIDGETKPHRAELKEAGCKWASKKKKWYWHPAWMHSRNRKERSMDEIRAKYGSVSFKSDDDDNKKIGA